MTQLIFFLYLYLADYKELDQMWAFCVALNRLMNLRLQIPTAAIIPGILNKSRGLLQEKRINDLFCAIIPQKQSKLKGLLHCSQLSARLRHMIGIAQVYDLQIDDPAAHLETVPLGSRKVRSIV